jgi:hypothetical protein
MGECGLLFGSRELEGNEEAKSEEVEEGRHQRRRSNIPRKRAEKTCETVVEVRQKWGSCCRTVWGTIEYLGGRHGNRREEI